jgi:hypothetical protein
LYGYHPAGVNRTSTTCQRKQANYDVMAIWANRKGRSVYRHHPSASVSNNSATQRTQASQLQPTDRDRGRKTPLRKVTQ